MSVNESKLLSFVDAHGFDAWLESGLVVIAIPASRDGRSDVMTFERCEPTWRDVRLALGY